MTTASTGAAQTKTVEPGRQQVTTFATTLESIRSAVFNQDGSLLYIGGVTQRTGDAPPVACLSVWDTTTCSEVKRILLGSSDDEVGREFRGCVALSPDGQWLAAAAENDIKLLDTGTWRGKAVLRNDSIVFSLAFSRDGKRLLAGCLKSVRLWDLESGVKSSSFEALTFKAGDTVFSDRHVAFSGDGKRIAFDAFGDKGRHIEVWNVGAALEAKFEDKRSGDSVVCFDPLDNNLLFGRRKLWNIREGKDNTFDPEQPEREVRIAFGLDPKSKAPVKALYYIKADNSEGKVWLPGEKTPRSFIGWYRSAAGEISVSPDGTKLVYFHGGTVTLWDLAILAKAKGEKR